MKISLSTEWLVSFRRGYFKLDFCLQMLANFHTSLPLNFAILHTIKERTCAHVNNHSHHHTSPVIRKSERKKEKQVNA